MRLPQYIKKAILCGPTPRIRNWKKLPHDKLTIGESVLRFAYDHLVFPEGVSVGKRLELDLFQQVFILATFDAPQFISKAILSIARRNGKTLVMAVILLAFIIGPLKKQNTLVRSAAMTRDQAALLYRLMALICEMSPDLAGLYHVVPSAKKIVGLVKNVEYQALSRDAKAGHGQNMYVLVVDECGQIDAPNDDFLDMLFSSQGSFDDARTFLISTQAPSDAAFFSIEIDAATRDRPEHVVCHVYTAPDDDITKKSNWHAANPGLRGGYRSMSEIINKAKEAIQIPAKQAGFMNLMMNRRVARVQLWLAPKIWGENSQPPELSIFEERGAHLGLDLSLRNDLTAAVLAQEDDEGQVHLVPYAFTPMGGLRERARRDRVPYDMWVEQGIVIGVPGDVLDYDWLCEYLRENIEDAGIHINTIQFDRWRIRELQSAAARAGFAQDAEWTEVGQGFVGFSPRIEHFETLLLQRKICHGRHPVLNLGAAAAVVQADPAGNRKLAKNKSTQKIDALVAAVMAAHPLAHSEEDFDAHAIIG